MRKLFILADCSRLWLSFSLSRLQKLLSFQNVIETDCGEVWWWDGRDFNAIATETPHQFQKWKCALVRHYVKEAFGAGINEVIKPVVELRRDKFPFSLGGQKFIELEVIAFGRCQFLPPSSFVRRHRYTSLLVNQLSRLNVMRLTFPSIFPFHYGWLIEERIKYLKQQNGGKLPSVFCLKIIVWWNNEGDSLN